jgi:D-glycero-alpha-D-manno-heptose-7-phosphate kinase
MIIRSKAPLRIGIAGGGTDISPYCDKYGGCVLNATIDLFTYCTIVPTKNNIIKFIATDRKEYFSTESKNKLIIDENLPLHKGIYNRLVEDYNLEPLSFEMTTYSDAPAGSGLGTSSTLVVCILKAFIEWLNLPLGEYEIARLAFKIERIDLNFSGGKQDQYAATFGGFNFMEFNKNNNVIVNPLRIKRDIINELEISTLLFFTGVSRSSSKIIKHQTNSITNVDRLHAMHQVKQMTFTTKEAILKGDFKLLFDTFKDAWEEKKKTSSLISNSKIDKLYQAALDSGAHCGKISGAGGGGFMLLFINPLRKNEIIERLSLFKGNFVNVKYNNEGAQSWTIH